MRKISTFAAAAALLATVANADDYGDFDHFIPLEPYEGQSFEIDVPCLEQGVQEYVSVVEDFNSELGVVYAGNPDYGVIVSLIGERAESNAAMVQWLQVSTPGSESFIGFRADGTAETNAAYNDGYNVEGRNNAAEFVRFIQDYNKTCPKHG